MAPHETSPAAVQPGHQQGLPANLAETEGVTPEAEPPGDPCAALPDQQAAATASHSAVLGGRDAAELGFVDADASGASGRSTDSGGNPGPFGTGGVGDAGAQPSLGAAGMSNILAAGQGRPAGGEAAHSPGSQRRKGLSSGPADHRILEGQEGVGCEPLHEIVMASEDSGEMLLPESQHTLLPANSLETSIAAQPPPETDLTAGGAAAEEAASREKLPSQPVMSTDTAERSRVGIAKAAEQALTLEAAKLESLALL